MTLDLRTRPDWAPLHGTLTIGGWRIALWEEARLPEETCQDTTLIAPFGRTLRLGVADAAENVLVPDSHTRALHATHTLRRWLACETDLDTALTRASSELCDPAVRPRQRNHIVTTAVVDLNLDSGALYAARCADSEVWVRRDGQWQALFPGDMLTATARADYRAAVAGLGHADLAEIWRIEEALLDDPDQWVSGYIGQLPEPKAQRVRLDSVEEVILATDGARLTAERCADLANWLSCGLQQAPDGHPHPSPHGDLAVLHAYRHAAA